MQKKINKFETMDVIKLHSDKMIFFKDVRDVRKIKNCSCIFYDKRIPRCMLELK